MRPPFSKLFKSKVSSRLTSLKDNLLLKELVFQWIPGHCGIIGKVTADELAKHEANQQHPYALLWTEKIKNINNLPTIQQDRPTAQLNKKRAGYNVQTYNTTD